MKTIGYKKNTDEVIERLKMFYNREAQNRIFASFDIPGDTLAEFCEKNPEGFCTYPDPHERIRFWDALLKEHMAVEDDSIPSAYLSEFDQALYGGLVGGKAQFMCHDNGWISSMVPPLLNDWSEFDTLAVDKNHPWYERFINQMDVFVKGAGENFGISHFILIDGLNFAFELVGATKTYESLLDYPEMVSRAVDFAFDLNVMVQQTFFEHAPSYRDGTFSNMVQWIPGRIVSESVDPFHMTSVDYFESWGRKNIERMFARFDGGVLHIHGNGRHLIEAVSTLDGLKAIWLGDDTGFPKAFGILHELKKLSGDVPLVTTVTYNEFAEKLNSHGLPGGVFYQVTDTPDADTANKCMDRVRSYCV